jgi:hypothetical protein
VASKPERLLTLEDLDTPARKPHSPQVLENSAKPSGSTFLPVVLYDALTP